MRQMTASPVSRTSRSRGSRSKSHYSFENEELSPESNSLKSKKTTGSLPSDHSSGQHHLPGYAVKLSPLSPLSYNQKSRSYRDKYSFENENSSPESVKSLPIPTIRNIRDSEGSSPSNSESREKMKLQMVTQKPNKSGPRLSKLFMFKRARAERAQTPDSSWCSVSNQAGGFRTLLNLKWNGEFPNVKTERDFLRWRWYHTRWVYALLMVVLGMLFVGAVSARIYLVLQHNILKQLWWELAVYGIGAIAYFGLLSVLIWNLYCNRIKWSIRNWHTMVAVLVTFLGCFYLAAVAYRCSIFEDDPMINELGGRNGLSPHIPYRLAIVALFVPHIVSKLGASFLVGFAANLVITVEAAVIFLVYDLDAEPIILLALNGIVWFTLNASYERSQRGAFLSDRFLRDQIESRTTMINFLFHEIRNPLNALMGGVEYMRTMLAKTTATLEGGDTVELKLIVLECERDIEDQLRCCKHMRDLMNTLLQLTRLEAGSVHLSSEGTSITQLCNHVREVVGNSNRNVEMMVDIDKVAGQEMWVLCDQLKLQQVMVNLVHNALKATHVGFVLQRVQILDHDIDDGCVTLLFAVVDSGIGISSNDQRLIMQHRRMSQVQDQSLTQPKGIGIGLSLCTLICRLFGSKLRVESTLLTGSERELYFKGELKPVQRTRFSFELRLKTCVPDFGCQSRSGSTFITGGQTSRRLPEKLRVLVADDEPTNVKILSRKLTSMDPFKDLEWRVDTCRSGEEALRMVHDAERSGEQRFTILFLDQDYSSCPGSVIKGTEVCREIQKMAEPPYVIGSTGNCTEEDKHEWQLAGSLFVWAKPIPSIDRMYCDLCTSLIGMSSSNTPTTASKSVRVA
eukprot:990827_1